MSPALAFVAGIVCAFAVSGLTVFVLILVGWRRQCREQEMVESWTGPDTELHRCTVEGKTLDALAVGLRKAAAHVEARCVEASLRDGE